MAATLEHLPVRQSTKVIQSKKQVGTDSETKKETFTESEKKVVVIENSI
jgi:hypothetical protein